MSLHGGTSIMGLFIIPLTAIIALGIGIGLPVLGAQREAAAKNDGS